MAWVKIDPVEAAAVSILLTSPVVFLDDDELAACVEMFSERIRSDALLRPALDRLVGNRWADAERQAYRMFHATLFRDECPQVEANWLARAARVLSPDQVDRLADILLSCVFETFPVHTAGDLCDIATELANTLKSIIATDGLERQRRLLKMHARLNAGALLNGL